MVHLLLSHQHGSCVVVSSQSLLRNPQNPNTLIGVFHTDRCHSSSLLLQGKERGFLTEFLTVPPALVQTRGNQCHVWAHLRVAKDVCQVLFLSAVMKEIRV